MRFRIVVLERRLVREVWHVEADNREEAVDCYHDGCADFDEEECLDTPESWIDEVESLDDPEGLLETDEGL